MCREKTASTNQSSDSIKEKKEEMKKEKARRVGKGTVDQFSVWREEDVSREKEQRKQVRGSQERMDSLKFFDTKTKERKRTQEKVGVVELKANRKPTVGKMYTWPTEQVVYEGGKRRSKRRVRKG